MGLTERARMPLEAVVALMALLAALLVVGPVEPAGAQGGGGSITYIQGGELWVLDPADPGSARPLAPGVAVQAQAQDDQGRVVVGLDDASVVQLSRDGQVLAGPFVPAPAAQALAWFDVTPAGDVFTYTAIASCSDGSGLLCGFVDFHRTDGGDSSAVQHVIDDARETSFFGDGRVVYDQQGAASLTRLGSDATEEWFVECDQFPCEEVRSPAISPDLRHLASADTQNTDAPDFLFFDRLRIHQLEAPPPAVPTEVCTITTPSGDDNVITGISWSPDGTALVFEEYLATDTSGEFEPVGIWLVEGIGTSSCDQVQASLRLLVGGDAGAPDWGPAPVGGGTAPPPPPGPPTGAPLVDGERVDGGGQADPIGQAITTSQRLFSDGSADRVVLATADRFPDALAGAPLAGVGAPILLTGGTGDLDPRVGVEISRVTGGQGVVLTLGGTAAVSEAAAQQARAAAGDVPCAAPLPVSCRYAGTGREDTARLIARTVIAEHPGSTALVARGDAFADAITGGAYAAAAGVPVLLTPPDSVSPPTAEFLAAEGIEEVIVLGGTAAIDEPTFQALPGSDKRRVAGAERTETSALVASQLWAPSGLEQGGAILVEVRGEDSWQTALSAAVAAARFGAPQLGVEPPPVGLSPAVMAQADRLGSPIAAFGSPAQVSDAQLAAAASAAP